MIRLQLLKILLKIKLNSNFFIGLNFIIFSSFLTYGFLYSFNIFPNFEQLNFKLITLIFVSLFYKIGFFFIKRNDQFHELMKLNDCLYYLNHYIKLSDYSFEDIIYMFFLIDVYHLKTEKKSMFQSVKWQVIDKKIHNKLVEDTIQIFILKNSLNKTSYDEMRISKKLLKNKVDYLDSFIKKYKNESLYENNEIKFLIPLDKNHEFEVSDYYKF